MFGRQLILGDTLATDRVAARYDAGGFAVRVPIVERAKPRKITISGGSSGMRTVERWRFGSGGDSRVVVGVITTAAERTSA